MPCEFICDGCGKRDPGFWMGFNWHKPQDWFLRADKDGPQLACSRECVAKIAEKTGKTRAVLPI